MSETPDDLPEYYKEARAKDEPFWIQQEKRVQGALAQPCCTLSGFGTNLITMEGDFAVVIHGEDECASCFRHVGVNAHNFYATGLTEKHFVTGETREPLERCLRLVATESAPEAIFVLGACPVEVIGDRFETTVAKVQADFPDIPMVPLHTSGLKAGSQASMLDWLFSTLAALPGLEPSDQAWRRSVSRVGVDIITSFLNMHDDGLEWAQYQMGQLPARRHLGRDECLNFVGLPRDTRGKQAGNEAIRALADAGLTVVGNYPMEARFAQWRSITHAKASFVADRSLYPKLVNVLEERGQQVIEVPLPTGIEQTDAFYRTIGEVYGKTDEIMASVAEARARAVAARDAFREQYGNLRLAMGMRMLNNYEADQLAYQGLGDYRALAELGFDLTIMVQGPPDKRAKFEKMFSVRQIEHPFEMFPEPWNLSEYIGGDRFDAAYMADHARGECRKAGVPMIVSREMHPFYEGVPDNLRQFDRILRNTARR